MPVALDEELTKLIGVEPDAPVEEAERAFEERRAMYLERSQAPQRPVRMRNLAALEALDALKGKLEAYKQQVRCAAFLDEAEQLLDSGKARRAQVRVEEAAKLLDAAPHEELRLRLSDLQADLQAELGMGSAGQPRRRGFTRPPFAAPPPAAPEPPAPPGEAAPPPPPPLEPAEARPHQPAPAPEPAKPTPPPVQPPPEPPAPRPAAAPVAQPAPEQPPPPAREATPAAPEDPAPPKLDPLPPKIPEESPAPPVFGQVSPPMPPIAPLQPLAVPPPPIPAAAPPKKPGLFSRLLGKKEADDLPPPPPPPAGVRATGPQPPQFPAQEAPAAPSPPRVAPPAPVGPAQPAIPEVKATTPEPGQPREESSADRATLLLADGRRLHLFCTPALRLGRANDADMQVVCVFPGNHKATTLANRTISRKHLEFFCDGNRVQLLDGWRDTGTPSVQGVSLDGVRMTQGELTPGRAPVVAIGGGARAAHIPHWQANFVTMAESGEARGPGGSAGVYFRRLDAIPDDMLWLWATIDLKALGLSSSPLSVGVMGGRLVFTTQPGTPPVQARGEIATGVRVAAYGHLDPTTLSDALLL